MSSGEAYCRIMAKAFPGCLPIRKGILKARSSRKCMKNKKLFAKGLEIVGINKKVQWDRLAERRFEDNIKFSQWLKKLLGVNTCPRTALISGN